MAGLASLYGGARSSSPCQADIDSQTTQLGHRTIASNATPVCIRQDEMPTDSQLLAYLCTWMGERA